MICCNSGFFVELSRKYFLDIFYLFQVIGFTIRLFTNTVQVLRNTVQQETNTVRQAINTCRPANKPKKGRTQFE